MKDDCDGKGSMSALVRMKSDHFLILSVWRAGCEVGS